MPLPAGEVARASALGYGSIDRRAAAQHLAAPCRYVISRTTVLALEAPIVILVSAQTIGIGQYLRIAFGWIDAAGFQQQRPPPTLVAQSIGEHAARGSTTNDDDVEARHILLPKV